MMYIDYAYAGKVATVGTMAVVGVVVAAKKLAEFAVYCDAEAQRVAREQGDAPDEGAALRRFDDALAAMDEPDEHELARYVG